MMPRDTLAGFASVPDPDEAANSLLNEAMVNGGRDNISLVLIDDLGDAVTEAAPDEEAAE
jgi:serine/threonine protein phosphatase PrpC